MKKAEAYSSKRIMHHPQAIKAFQNGHLPIPIQVRLKPVNRCNHDCFFCAYASSSRKSSTISSSVFDHIDTGMHDETDLSDIIDSKRLLALIKEIAEYGVKSLTYSGGGEPTIHPAFYESLMIANQLGLDTSIITNGALIKDEWLKEFAKMKWIRISMDYNNSGELQAHRNVPEQEFEKIIRNLTKLSEYVRDSNSETCIGINYIVHNGNYENLVDLVSLLDSTGVDNIRISPMWLPNFHEYHSSVSNKIVASINKAEAVAKNIRVYSTYDISHPQHSCMRSRKECYIQKVVPVIGADCYIYRCHHKAFTSLGRLVSIKNQSFGDAWDSLAGSSLFDNFNSIDSCKHQCVYDDRNTEISDAINNPCNISPTSALQSNHFANFL